MNALVAVCVLRHLNVAICRVWRRGHKRTACGIAMANTAVGLLVRKSAASVGLVQTTLDSLPSS